MIAPGYSVAVMALVSGQATMSGRPSAPDRVAEASLEILRPGIVGAGNVMDASDCALGRAREVPSSALRWA
jgi:hypothetical protein